MKEIDDKYIVKSIGQLGNFLSYFVTILLIALFSGFIYLYFESVIAFLIGFSIITTIFIIYCIGRYGRVAKTDNWYISKEILVTTKVMGEYDEFLYAMLYDGNKVLINEKLSFGDVIYVVRMQDNNKPRMAFSDKNNLYIGNKNVVDNTQLYNNKYFSYYSEGKQYAVTPETHSMSNGQFQATTYHRASIEEKNDKVLKIILVLVIMTLLSLASFISKQRVGYIMVEAKVVNIVQVETKDGLCVYDYYLEYTVGRNTYHTIVKKESTNYLETYYKDRRLYIYVNKDNYEEVYIEDWEFIDNSNY